MGDTQWPRFQVFLQEKEGEAHQDVGSVHAPDAELALQNARDVFVRRPECFNLWVVPVSAIHSKTAQELSSWEATETAGESATEAYYVFCKRKPAGTQTLAGMIEANSPAQAMQRGVAHYGRRAPALVWWVLPARAVTSSDPQDVDSLFTPALEKLFRLATDFHTHSTMRSIRKNRERPGEDGQTGKPGRPPQAEESQNGSEGTFEI